MRVYLRLLEYICYIKIQAAIKAITSLLSTIMSANRLIIIDQDRAAETGSREELVNRDGSCRKLILLQFNEYRNLVTDKTMEQHAV